MVDFFVPQTENNFLQIIADTYSHSTAILDGLRHPEWSWDSFQTVNWPDQHIITINISSGSHTFSANGLFTLTVFGYGTNSYTYAYVPALNTGQWGWIVEVDRNCNNVRDFRHRNNNNNNTNVKIKCGSNNISWNNNSTIGWVEQFTQGRIIGEAEENLASSPHLQEPPPKAGFALLISSNVYIFESFFVIKASSTSKFSPPGRPGARSAPSLATLAGLD